MLARLVFVKVQAAIQNGLAKAELKMKSRPDQNTLNAFCINTCLTGDASVLRLSQSSTVLHQASCAKCPLKPICQGDLQLSGSAVSALPCAKKLQAVEGCQPEAQRTCLTFVS